MIESKPSPSGSRAALIWRGWCERCPKCGNGKLYVSYLKPRKICVFCGEDLSTLRADDGPAWLTIIVTGHLAVPLAISLSMGGLPAWQALPLLLGLICLIALLILPRAKGIFIAMLWFNRQNPVVGNGKYDTLTKL